MDGKILRITLLIGCVMAAMLLWPAEAQAQLKPEFLRNGECYLLIGEGPPAMRGIYRLNNPEANKYFSPAIYLFTPNNSFTFAVDLNRKIYTFTEQVETGYTFLSSKLKRQVIDTVAANQADYGYHTWIHYDHRPWGKNTAVYRTGPVGRDIRRNGGGVWANFKSAGPGASIPTPAGNPLPTFTGKLALGIYTGKNWYEIPNGSWYSSWKTAGAIHNGYSIFYVVFGDKEEGKAHNWKLYTWTPDNMALDAPAYTSSVGSTVATSYDKQITRRIYAGCLDGCGGASGSGSGEADVMLNDLAFMPPIKTEPSRTYFYSRADGKPDFEVTLNGTSYTPPAGNPIIGNPYGLDTYWIGVSMRNITSDYVYTLGNNVIKDWYNIVTGSPATGMNISAVAVSNQWNQEGGIVYAYDKGGKMLYKFIRKESSGTPLASDRYQALSMAAILSSIGAVATTEVDDIKADGFGSLYFAISHPSKNVADFYPPDHFGINDAMYLHVPSWTASSGEDLDAHLIYKQAYGKKVYERNVYDGQIREIGSKDYAHKHYNVAIRAKKECLLELAAAGAMPHSQTGTILASWSAQIGDNAGGFNKDDFSPGHLGLFYDYDDGDPGKCRLSVINVPTPPQVHSLGGKKSYLDLVGPYTSIPIYDTTNRHTNQGDGLISPAPAALNVDQLYFYMVENYPLPDGPQNPNSQPNWDNDGRMGGFISAMVDPKSSKNGGRVFYRWRTWLVQDLYGTPVCKPLNEAKPLYGTNTEQDEYFYFYSPVSGKYIMTCHVTYDWYDYDDLNFGDTIADLPSVKKTNHAASPAAVGAIAADPATSRLTAIMNTDPFNFMLASSTEYISQILEGGNNNFAVIPIVAGVGTDPLPIPSLEWARIQRCDEFTPVELANNGNWFPTGANANPPEGYHGIQAGRSYNWRIDVASQTNIFFDISKSTNTTVGHSQFNYVAYKLMQNLGVDGDGKEINPFYVNRKPEFQFRNRAGTADANLDLKWKDSDIRVTAHLEYKVPKDGGGFTVEKKFLIQDPANPGEPLPVPAIPASFPIITTTGVDLPPTDPYDAELVITMRRMFEYNMWLRIWNGSNWIWGSFLTLPKDMIITSKTTVRIIDLQKPQIVFSETNPMNLFGKTGMSLTIGDGPAGHINPGEVKFTIKDNNPWEAVDAELGLEDEATILANKNFNNTIISPTTGNFLKPKPTAQFNLKPVFSKLSRTVALQLETARRNPHPQHIGSYSKSLKPASSDYIHDYFKNTAGAIVEQAARFTVDSQTFYETTPSGEKEYRAIINYKMPLNYVRIGEGDSLQIPAGYANNTPGYKVGSTINPYFFHLSATDSSGNTLDFTKLNMALHVKDVIRPCPYGIAHEMKDGRISVFPASEMIATSSIADFEVDWRNKFALNENVFADSPTLNSNLWSADDAGLIGKFNISPVYSVNYTSLKTMGNDVVTAFDDAVYRAQVDNGIIPGFVEDNVNVVFKAGVSDNAGVATSTMTIKFLDAEGNQGFRTVTSTWASSANNQLVATGTTEAAIVFRGLSNQFPMAVPIEIIANDNARDWDYYNGGSQADVNNPYSEWIWGPVISGGPAQNGRTYRTSMPVYGSKLIIRTIDKGIRNQ